MLSLDEIRVLRPFLGKGIIHGGELAALTALSPDRMMQAASRLIATGVLGSASTPVDFEELKRDVLHLPPGNTAWARIAVMGRLREISECGGCQDAS